jgi:glucose/arabinose dehydrogenase/cytochrome c2
MTWMPFVAAFPLLLAAPSARPGLVGRYAPLADGGAPAAAVIVRLDPAPVFDWRDGAPDERLAGAAFEVRWRGRLLVPEDGAYRFALECHGRAELRIDGAVAASVGEGERAASSAALALESGLRRLEIHYRAPVDGAALAVSWSRSGEPLEPIPARALFHDDGDAAGDPAHLAAEDAYQRGRRLAERLGCERCHGEGGERASERGGGAPRLPIDLRHASWLRPDWLHRFLADPAAARPGTPMPSSRGAPERRREDAAALAAFLIAAANAPPERPQLAPGSARRGRERFEALGCRACHDPESASAPDLLSPARLADAGDKWDSPILVRVLRHPWDLPHLEAMPNFHLDEIEALDIGAYLEGLSASAGGGGESAPLDPALAERGRRLFGELGCLACHESPEDVDGETAPPRAPELAGRALDAVERGCLSAEDPRREVPRYDLAGADRAALSAYFAARPRQPARPAAQELARRWMREGLGCLACHERDGDGGLGPLPAPEPGAAAGIAPGLERPPDLSGAGARLRRDWIQAAVEGGAAPVRPWISMRMPQYSLRASTVEILLAGILAADGAASNARPSAPQAAPEGVAAAAELRAAGRRLLGPAGFNCQQCHYLGPHQPASHAVGPDLAYAARRIERAWFERWLDAPQRARPGTPMPAIAAAVPGLLGGDLSAQKDALWRYLAETPPEELAFDAAPPRRFDPAADRPSAVQGRVRGAGALRAERGLALGWSAGHSLLFDAGRLSWLGSWSGAFLEREGGLGGHGHWRPAGAERTDDPRRGPPVLFRAAAGARWRSPGLVHERFGDFEMLAEAPGGVRIEYQLRFEGGRRLRVSESIDVQALPSGALRLSRRVRLESAGPAAGAVEPSGGQWLVLAAPWMAGLAGDPAGLAALDGASIERAPVLRWRRGSLRVEASAGAAWALAPGAIEIPILDGARSGAAAVEEEDGAGRLAAALEAGADTAIDFIFELPSAAAPPRPGPAAPAPIAAGPGAAAMEQELASLTLPDGYTASRLRLPEEFLPSSLCFFRGRLLAGGYDGEIQWAIDGDGDGLPERYQRFAGPIDQASSLAARGDRVLAASPAALHAFRDVDGDGRADECRTISSRWDFAGHPFDFFFGFAFDADGNIYGSNSTPFERGGAGTAAGADAGDWNRGAILKIAPGGETAVFASGTRLEFGWATDAAGRSFFSTNQGPWTPTCAIALLEKGASFGYRQRDPSKITPPVVRAPYPWCRSLSGIAFAETGGRFGAFEGQGLAGDFNTRRVIRWTHDAAGARRQGACYDFAGGFELGPTALAFGPDGALYVAAMVDGTWLQGEARGGIYRIEAAQQAAPDAPRPFEVLEARARRDGFELRFTEALDPASLAGGSVKARRFAYEYRGGYFSEEIAHEELAFSAREVAPDGRSLRLRLAAPQLAPRIAALRLLGLRSAAGRPLRGGTFYVTVNGVPEE